VAKPAVATLPVATLRQETRPTAARKASVRRGNPRLVWLIGGGGAVVLLVVVLAAMLFFRPKSPDKPPVAELKSKTKTQQNKPQQGKPEPSKLEPMPAGLEPAPETVISLPRDLPKTSLPETPDGSLTPATLKRVKDATIFISVRAADGESFTGSGFLALGPGLIVTNAHVIDMKDPFSAEPEQVHATLWNGEPQEKRLDAQILGVDRDADLALLRFVQNGEYEQTGVPPPLPIAASKDLRETQRVFIFGFPLAHDIGKNVTVSASSVSSLRKNVSGALDEVQVNGGMHPGNSGGPVVDSGGNVVGIAVSGIRGTQIQFAIPCEKVFDFVAGRVLSAKAGEAKPAGARFDLAVALKLLDPLKNVQKMEVEWWQGQPGTVRPASLSRPEPQPGDGARQTQSTYFDRTTAMGEARLLLPALPRTGQVIWVQPVLYGKDGKPSWGVASAHAILPAPDAKPALLSRKPAPEKQVLRLSVRSTVQAVHGEEGGTTVLNTSDTQMVEETKEPQNQRINFSRAEFDLAVNGKGSAMDASDQQALGELKSAGIDLQLDDKGNLVKSTPDLKNVNTGKANRKILEQYLEHIRLGLEALAVPLPGGKVDPGQKWQAVRPLSFGPLEKVYPAKFDMTYSFRGVRMEEGREVGVLELSGQLKPYKTKDRELTGKASGGASVDLGTGQVVRVSCTLEVVQRLRVQNLALPVAYRTMEMSLTRGKSR
jgi:S1-C subfamily serine protease